jgi:hypothetical protein
VFLNTVILLSMLKRAPMIGQLILMITEMIDELQRFGLTVGVILLCFVLITRISSREFKTEDTDIYASFQDMFNAFVGNQASV